MICGLYFIPPTTTLNGEFRKKILPALILKEFRIECVAATLTSDNLFIGSASAPWSK